MKKNCTICDAEFSDNYGLKRHIKRMHTIQKCVICEKEYTKHDAGLKNNSKTCSEACRKIYWSDYVKGSYAKLPIEKKEKSRQRVREYQTRKRQEDPEWGLAPLVECTCPICSSTFTQRGTRRKFCSDACSEVNRQRYRENKLKELREATIENMKEITCIVCGETKLTYHAHTKFCNKKCRSKHENSQPKHKARKLKWQREQRKNPNSWFNQTMQQITSRMRNGLRQSLQYKGVKKTNQTFSLVDYTKYELKEHLESQFTDGMSWENMGEWHIDHIRPVASFNFDSTDHPEFKQCWALENLQPMWKLDNLSKGSLWEGKRHRHKVKQ
jgi:endogenous inhibitor of DNA gyrase (YacG/DUF329 family)|tara:strand:+ start:1019 stop:1999 length:981 start_codon:yes stop_codon:yes gene_type:complete